MRNLAVFLMVTILLTLVVGTASPLQAQTAPGPLTCPELVQAALQALEDNCTGVGRNTACYANNLVQSSFSEPVPDDYFSQPADLADIVTLSSMVTSPMDEANNLWGIALMNVQANLPGTLPGQSVTLLLMGDAVVGNAVPEDQAALPVPPIGVVTNSAAEVRTLPQPDALLAGTTGVDEPLAADARTPDNLWVRVVVAAEPAYGGWVQSAALNAFDLAQLPVVDANTRTPMQAFVFRTGIGQPSCAEAPNSVIVQGPSNTQVIVNVNGADLSIGSTVRLSSVEGAPLEIIESLDLPDEVADQLGDASSENGNNCGVMAMNVLSGSVEVNDGSTILPAGNTAYAVACEEETGAESTPEPGAPPTVPNVDFSSEWGAFGQMSQEELDALAPLEQVDDTILNYQIVLPNEDDIQPPITATPTPQPGGFAATRTPVPTPAQTPTPTPNPTIPPGTGLSTNVVINPAANNQIAAVGQPLPVPFSVRITDPYGGASIGVPVTFSAPASGASGIFTATGTNTQTVNTDQSGNAVASPFVLNTIAGPYSVTASAPQDVGFFASAPGKESFGKPALQAQIAASFAVTNAPGAPAFISAAPGGTGLSATVTTTYTSLPAVLVTDSYSNPVPFAPVGFAAQTGGSGATGSFGGSPTANSATGFDGVASAPFLTANTVAGAFQIAVYSLAGTVNLDMTNLPDVPSSLTATFGGGQSTTVATAFPSFLIGLVTDVYGNAVPGTSVTFTAPASGASAGFLSSGTNSETVITDGTGFATSSAVIANTVAGSYNVGAAAGALTASYALTNNPGAAATMIISGGDGQSATINTAFSLPLSVSVTDSYGNAAVGAPVTFTPPGSGASGTFGGPATVNANASGVAVSPVFTANSTGGGYTVTATSTAGAAGFTMTNVNPVPIITLISPASATAGDSGFTLTIGGANFVPGMQVSWTGQANLNAVVGSSTSATVAVPASYIAAPGTPSVNVINPGPGGGTGAGPLTFTVNPGTVVTNLNDSGPGSLRDIIANAPAGSTITFGVSGTITLTSGVIGINKNLTINGSNPYQVTISGNNASRVFNVGGAGVSVAIYGIRVINGFAGGGDGGAIYQNPGTTLNIAYSVFENNVAGTSTCCGKGGVIFNDSGSLNIYNSSLRNNTAGTDPSNNYGGAIAVFNSGTAAVTQSCLTGNVDPINSAIFNFTANTIDATNNWWGNAGGPGAGGANTTSGSVTTAPFATSPIPFVVDC